MERQGRCGLSWAQGTAGGGLSGREDEGWVRWRRGIGGGVPRGMEGHSAEEAGSREEGDGIGGASSACSGSWRPL